MPTRVRGLPRVGHWDRQTEAEKMDDRFELRKEEDDEDWDDEDEEDGDDDDLDDDEDDDLEDDDDDFDEDD